MGGSRLRPGNAGFNTAADHITVLTEELAQIPSRHRRDLLVTVDGADATRELVGHLTRSTRCPGRRVHYSVGFDLNDRARTAIGQVPQGAWAEVSEWNRRPPSATAGTRRRLPPENKIRNGGEDHQGQPRRGACHPRE